MARPSYANAISGLYSAGFGPSGLACAGAAAVLPSGVLRLVDGTGNRNGAAFYDKQVAWQGNWTVEFAVRVTGTPPGYSFTLQNGMGRGGTNADSPYTDASRLDCLGVRPGANLSFAFWSHGFSSSDFAGQTPTATASNAVAVFGNNTPDAFGSYTQTPITGVTLASGHPIYHRIARTSGLTSDSYALTVTDTTTGASWSGTLTTPHLTWTLTDEPGDLAFAGFTASDGGSGNTYAAFPFLRGTGSGTVDVLWWTWAGSTATAPAHTYTLTVGTAGKYSAGVVNGSGDVVRTLFVNSYLTTGSYSVGWDGLDDAGNAVGNPGSATVLAKRSQESVSLAVLGQTPGDPYDRSTAVPCTPVYGVAVPPDASKALLATQATDQSNSAFRALSASTGLASHPDNVSVYFPAASFDAVACDAQYCYALARLTTSTGAGVFKFDHTAAPAWHGAWGGPVTNSDGSSTTTVAASYDFLQISGSFTLNTRPFLAVAVSNPGSGASGYLAVADFAGDRVRLYDKTSAAWLRSVSVTAPKAVAFDGAGNLWVGHGSGSGGTSPTLSAYDPATGSKLADSGVSFTDIVSLCGHGTSLAVADDGAKAVKVYPLTGTTLGSASPSLSDSRWASLWGVCLDASGDVYVTAATKPNRGYLAGTSAYRGGAALLAAC